MNEAAGEQSTLMSAWWAPGRSAATLACRLAARGRTRRRGRPRRRCRRWSIRISTAAPMRSPPARARMLEAGRAVGRAAASRPARSQDIRVSDGRVGRRGLAAVPAFRPARRRRRARSAGWWRRAACAWRSTRICTRCPSSARASPRPTAQVERRADGRRRCAIAGGPDHRVPAGGRGRGAGERRCGSEAGHRRSRACPTRQPASSAPSRTSGRTATHALEHFLPAGPFAQLPMARHRGRAERLRHRLDRADRGRVDRLMALDDAGLRPRGRPPPRRPSRRGPPDRPALALSARRAARASLRRHAAGPGGRRRARHPSDRRPGPQPRLPRRDRAGRAGDRGRAARAATPARPALLARYQRRRRARTTCYAGRDRRARPAVQHRQPRRCASPATSASPPCTACRPLKRLFMRQAMGL